jgi:hypothetical protein
MRTTNQPVTDEAVAWRRFDRLAAAVEADAVALRAMPRLGGGDLVAATESLFLDEVLSSTALAGIELDRLEGAALLSRGIALGGRRLSDYEAIGDYAEAARYVDSHGPVPAHRPRAFIRTEEILEAHRRAMLRTGKTPGAWRDRNVAAVASGMVPPPHWLVTREIAAFVDRYSAGPPPEKPRLRWVAGAHARLLRVQPFEDGNGRVGRLIANLFLRRLGLPVAAFTGRLGARYGPALARADSSDLAPLAELFAAAIHNGLTRLLGAAAGSAALLPLRRLVEPAKLPALIKAAQRGRLRVVRSGTRLLSTAEWIAEYEASRAKGRLRTGREPTAR